MEKKISLNIINSRISLFLFQKHNMKVDITYPNFLRIIIYFTITIFIFSCSQTQPKQDCPLGQPIPIFSDSLDLVSKHSFEASGQKGMELILFQDGTELELLQDGCEKVIQEYRFTITDFEKDWETDQWFEAADRNIRYMAGASQQHAAFVLWADAIKSLNEQWALGKELLLGPGFSAKVDKIISGQQAILVVIFFQS